ncbi:MAG: rhomboid family intramembrane serine protease [Myxococcota bacterium]|nr:rhomboid family intramembrane serine protease [Myxococcota bacterium]
MIDRSFHALRSRSQSASSASGSTHRARRGDAIPWLTCGLGVLALAATIALPALPDRSGPAAERAQAEAFAYWQAHGYLQATSATVDFARDRFEEHIRPIALAAIRELGARARPQDATSRKQEQAELDRLTRLAAVDPAGVNPLPADHPLRFMSFAPSRPAALGWIVHPFLHAGWLHFLSVAVFFLWLGAQTERRLGSRGFAGLLALALAASSGLHYLIDRDSAAGFFGGAGLVAALVGVWFVERQRALKKLPREGRETAVRTLVAVPSSWLLVSLLATVWLNHLGARNDYVFAPGVGGLLAGLAFGVAIRRQAPGATARRLPRGRRTRRQVDDDALSHATRPPSTVDEAFVALDMGDVDRAYTLFRHAARSHPEDLEITRALWSVATSTGQTQDVARPVAEQIRRQLRAGNAPAAAELWCELVESLPDARLPTEDLFRLVPALLDHHPVEFALAALRQCVDAPPGELRIGLALQILDTAETLDPMTALLAARRALDLPDLHESKRRRILERVRALDPEGPEAQLADATPEEPDLPENDLFDTPGEAADEITRDPASDIDDVLDDAVEAISAPSHAEASPPDPELTMAPIGAHAPPEIELVETARDEAPPIDLAALPRFDALALVAARPTSLRDDVLYFELPNGRRAKVAYDEVQAVAVAAVRDLAAKPVVVIDLLLNWQELGDAPLRAIRLRSDRFNPAHLVEAQRDATQTLRVFLAALLERSAAVPLPDDDAARGRPFRVYKFTRTYQRRVLKVDC